MQPQEKVLTFKTALIKFSVTLVQNYQNTATIHQWEVPLPFGTPYKNSSLSEGRRQNKIQLSVVCIAGIFIRVKGTIYDL